MPDNPGFGLKEAEALWERTYPTVVGACVGLAWLMWGFRLVCLSAKLGWHLDQLYTAVFGFLAISTGFLATFYGTVRSISDGFIGRIRDTRAMTRFLVMTKSAIITGFFVSLASIPMLIAAPAVLHL